jgi:uncharacterized protein YaaQ
MKVIIINIVIQIINKMENQLKDKKIKNTKLNSINKYFILKS